MKNDRKGTPYVVAQIVLIGAYLLAWGKGAFEIPNALSWIAVAGFIFGLALMALAAMQLNKNLSPFPTPRKQSRLITSGAYKYVRHPICTGLSLAAFAWAIERGNSIQLSLTTLLAGLLHFKAIHEEKLLIEVFEDYPDYQSKTGRLMPRLF